MPSTPVVAVTAAWGFAPLTSNTTFDPGTGLPRLSLSSAVTVCAVLIGFDAVSGVSVSVGGRTGSPPTALNPQMNVFGSPVTSPPFGWPSEYSSSAAALMAALAAVSVPAAP